MDLERCRHLTSTLGKTKIPVRQKDRVDVTPEVLHSFFQPFSVQLVGATAGEFVALRDQGFAQNFRVGDSREYSTHSGVMTSRSWAANPPIW